MFVIINERYKWRHGLPPVRGGERISVTCRVFKKDVFEQFQRLGGGADPEPAAMEPAPVAEDIVVVLRPNSQQHVEKITKLTSNVVSLAHLAMRAKQKLRIK